MLRIIKTHKGSASIEACVIVPVFTLMVIWIITTAVVCHDEAVIRGALTKASIDAEFLAEEKGKYDNTKVTQYATKATEYIKSRTMKEEIQADLENGLISIRNAYSEITKNNPVDHTRRIDALKKLLKKG